MSANARIIGIVAAGALAACSALGQAGEQRRAGAAAAQDMTEETLRHEGLRRSFLVHDFSDRRPAPVVIVCMARWAMERSPPR